ncbi:hypothetical protein BH10BAC4_BH10BAC4_06490 [soil metagenome]
MRKIYGEGMESALTMPEIVRRNEEKVWIRYVEGMNNP